MAKQLNVALDFTANTTQAKQQIQELQQLLTKVAYSTDLGIDPSQMKAASAAAKELAVHLNEAYNQKTGNYDLSKLNASLAKSKTSVTELSTSLLQAGTTGQQAFIKLAQSIAAADQPMITLNARLQDFLTTVKNTVKWQISSSMIHGVMGALQGAYHYAQDLNSSLNDIRIVTGHNIDYMDKFADKANKAAKALSTSTLNYTDASLIYYQQGLSDQEVEDRTAVTIKMANAAGESADKVSEQLTAVWNNFYDGSQSLEYYADVMTALGAATASSTDEIAEGLEKFAAVSNTVGLSYEYATSALATVTATTRQSADVVGTAFKTLFARIQDLELGETLDDGTTLGKYSQALDAVGVAIKTADGGLRDMDDILSDLGEKWNSLDAEGNPLISKDAKVALAQTVAGVRQYTQLMALMDNWDFMKENLETARNATGTLTEQQKIYEESWQAANKRLKASFESLYTDLIDDKFFIKLTDFLSDMVDGVDSFIDKIGGLKTLLIGFLSLVGQSISTKIQPALNELANNVRILTGGSDKVYGAMRNELSTKVNSEVERQDLSGKYIYNELQREQLKGTQRIGEAKQKLIQVENKLNATERRAAETALQGMEMQQLEIERLTKKRMDAQKEIDTFSNAKIEIEDLSGAQKQRNQAANLARSNMREIYAISLKNEKAAISQGIKFVNELIKESENNAVSAAEIVKQKIIEVNAQGANAAQEISGEEIFNGYIASIDKIINQIDTLQKQSTNGIIDEASLAGIKEGLDLITNSFPPLMSDLDQIPDALGDIYEAKENLDKTNISSEDIKHYYESVLKLRDAVKESKVPASDLVSLLRNLGYDNANIKKYLENLKQTKGLSEDLEKRLKQLNAEIKNTSFDHPIPFSETLTSLASAAGSAYMAVQSLSSMFQTLQDPDSTGWEKFGSVLMGFSMLVPSVISVLNGWSTAKEYLIQQANKNIASLTLENLVIGASAQITEESTKATLENALVNTTLTHEQQILSIAEALGIPITAGYTAELEAEVIAKLKDIAATKTLSGALKQLWLNLVPFLPILLPIVAVLGVAAASLYAATQRANAANEELENSNDSLENTQSNLTKVNDKLSTLKDTLDGLATKRTAIDDLTYGTTEWRQAVVDLNDEVSDLIKQYNLIKGIDWDTDSQGREYISEAGVNNIQSQLESQQKNLTNTKSAQEQQTDYRKIELEKDNLVKKYTLSGSANAVEDSYGATVDLQQITKNQINSLIEAKQKDETLNFDDPIGLKASGFSDSLINLLTSNKVLRNSLDDLVIATNAATDAYTNNLYNQLIDEGILGSLKNAGVQDSDYAAEIAYKIAQDINNTAINNKDSVDLQDDSATNSIIDAYLKANNMSYKDANGWKDFWSDSETIRAYTAQTESGDWDKDSVKTINLDEIKLWYAQEQAKNDALNNVSNYVPIEEDSKSVWSSVDSIKEKMGNTNFADTMNTLDENMASYRPEASGAQYLETINQIKSQIQELKPELADIFDTNVDSEAFNNMVKDTGFLRENAELLQKAFDGDAEAVNELRDKYDEYVATARKGKQIIQNSEELKEVLKTLGTNFEDLKSQTITWTDEFDKIDQSEENFDDLNKYVNQNADSLSKMAGMSETAFKSFISKGNNATKAAIALKAAADGDVTAVKQLRREAANEILVEMGLSTDIYNDIQTLQDSLIEFCDKDFETEIAMNPESLAAFKANCEQIIAQAGMTRDQANAYFAAMGYDVELEEHEGEPVTTQHSEQYAKFDGYKGGKPQFHTETLDMIDVQEAPKTYTVKSITPTGESGGGNAKIVNGNSSNKPKTGENTNPQETGGGDSYTPPDKKEYKDEIERYHVIKQKIEDLEEVMEHLAKAKDRAFGTSKLELMDQEIEKYDEMIDLQNQYLDEINKYWNEDRSLIASYGAEFDETGVITNYDEIMKRQIDKYNSSIGKNEDADEAAEEAYDDFIEALEQYEETNNLRQDELEKLYDLQTELADVIFEKTQYKIEIKIAVKDDELEYLDYLLSKIEDDAYSAAEAIALIGKKAENALEKTKTYSDGLLELLNNHGINSIEELDKLTVDDLKAKNFTEDEIDQIREWRSSILEANQELLEMRATIQEKVLDSFNQFSEDVQDQIDLFEHYQNILEGVKDITSLLGAQLNEQSKLVLRNLNRSLMNNSINNLAGAKQQVEALKQMRANAQEQYDKAVANEDSIGIKRWSDTLKEINEQVHSAEENFLDTWQEALERAHDIFEEEMDNIVKEFEDGISPIYGSIEALQDAITRANELNDQYLSDADKTYELNKLRRQIEGSIDDTDIIPHKQALNKLQDELNKKLKDGSKISEYDLKILQSKYELELARQKLEDVQNSNETVRLTRDNNGNWGYVYSADEDKIAEAEQEYEDKLNAYQKANEEYLKTLENNIIQLQSDYQEKLTAIKLSFTQGEISQAEYEKQAADLEKYYDERMQQIHQQYEEVFKNSKDANEKFVAYYKDSSGALVENFNQTTLALKTGYSTLDEMFNAFWKSHDDYVTNSNKLLDDYLNKLKEINSTAGIEGSFADEASGWSIKITGESDKAVADMGKIVKNATDSFNGVIKAASDWESIYVSKIDSAIKRNEALVKTMNEMVAALSGMQSIDYSKYENAIDSRSTATANNIISAQHNSESFNKSTEIPDYISQFSYLDMLDQLDMNKQIEDWMNNNELNIDTALMDSLDISTILQNIGLNVQTIVSYLSNLIPSSLGVDRIAQEFMQQVSINADFPNVTNSNEIMEAFEMMENEASQYASRKTI